MTKWGKRESLRRKKSIRGRNHKEKKKEKEKYLPGSLFYVFKYSIIIWIHISRTRLPGAEKVRKDYYHTQSS